MKNKPVLFILAFLFPIFTSAQYATDVVELKSGSIIKGIITEQYPDSLLKIRTSDGSLFVYKTSEILKVTREEKVIPKPEIPDLKTFGGIVSLGVAIGGGGLVGVPIRIYPMRKLAIELGVYARPMYVSKSVTYSNSNGEIYSKNKESKFSVEAHLGIGADIYFSEKYRPYDERVVKNGMMFKIGSTLSSDFTENMYVIGWARERTKKEHRKNTYVSELGIGVIHFDYEYPLYDALDMEDVHVIPVIYWKFNWNWFLQ